MPLGAIINIDVPHLEPAIRFYCDGLGFSFQRYLFDKDVAELDCASICICLLENPAQSRAVPDTAITRDYNPHWTPVHLDLLVDNLEKSVEQAIDHQATLHGQIQSHPYGRIQLMRDPFGHGFCLIEFNSAGYDSVHYKEK